MTDLEKLLEERALRPRKGTLKLYTPDAVITAYNLGLNADKWVSVGIKEPEIGAEIIIWYIPTNAPMMVEYNESITLKYFKFWMPLTPPNQLTDEK